MSDMAHLFLSFPLRIAGWIILPLFCLWLAQTSSFADDSGLILVEIVGIDAARGGNLIVALFDAEGSWPKHDSVISRKTIPVLGPALQVGFSAVATDQSYAVQVFHDSNRNDKLDFRWFPYPRPKEGVGISNNHQRLGPPAFEKALFNVGEPTTMITIQLNY